MFAMHGLNFETNLSTKNTQILIWLKLKGIAKSEKPITWSSSLESINENHVFDFNCCAPEKKCIREKRKKQKNFLLIKRK
jgi:hypothetical protein